MAWHYACLSSPFAAAPSMLFDGSCVVIDVRLAEVDPAAKLMMGLSDFSIFAFFKKFDCMKSVKKTDL